MADTTTKEGLVKLELDAGIYADAKSEGMSMNEFLEQKEVKAGYDPANPIGKDLTAFERQLMANDIPIGKANFAVEDFIKASPMSKVLFPEFINQNIYLGMNSGKLDVKLDDTHSVKTRVSQGSTKSVALDINASDLKAKAKSKEGSQFPRAVIATKENAISTRKVGIEIDFTYDALKRLQVLKAQHIFQVFGWNLSKQITHRALQVIKQGDGNANTAIVPTETATSTWKYSDLVNLLLNPTKGAEFTHAVVHPAFLEKILTDETNFKQFQSVNVLEGFLKDGEVAGFFGIDWKTHQEMDVDSIIVWNKNLTLELIEDAAGQLVESDKFIREQIQGSVISYDFEFAKLFSNSCAQKNKKA